MLMDRKTQYYQDISSPQLHLEISVQSQSKSQQFFLKYLSLDHPEVDLEMRICGQVIY